MKRFIVTAFLLFAVCRGVTAAEKIPGQRPLVLLNDTFQFIPGSWASYVIYDKAKDETYRMTFAVLEEKMEKGKKCCWMEIEVEMKDNPRVVTRFLAEETKQGPGELKKVIVQAEGYSPFKVPKKYFKGKNQEVGNFETAHVVKRLEQRTLSHKGKEIQAVIVEAEDSSGQKISATVSEELPPIAVFEVENQDIRMTVDDWGLGAKTKITGTAIPFWLWVTEQVGKGLSESGKK